MDRCYHTLKLVWCALLSVTSSRKGAAAEWRKPVAEMNSSEMRTYAFELQEEEKMT